jgi:hypothetical protein
VYISGPTATVLDPNKGYIPKFGEKPHEAYTLEMLREITKDPTKFHDCTEITKGNSVFNIGVAKKPYTNVVKKWDKKDCKECTSDMEVTNPSALEYMVAGGSIYGGSDTYDDDTWG